jgi:predicted translin family RNA/ssDNA-binding protein
MLNKKFLQKLKQDYDQNTGERRQIISRANIVLHDSKRVIFALHRGDVKKAEQSLGAIEKILKDMEKKFGYTRIVKEGAYNAGVEEYVEAKMFFKIINGEKIDKIKDITLSIEAYLGGISDTTGELVRLATNKAAKGEFKEVEKIKDIITDVMAELVEFDITGYLRTKYDQAKGNLRKVEQVMYDISIRRS